MSAIVGTDDSRPLALGAGQEPSQSEDTVPPSPVAERRAPASPLIKEVLPAPSNTSSASLRPSLAARPVSLRPAIIQPGANSLAPDSDDGTEPSMSPTERELVRRLRKGKTALPVLPQVATLAVRLAGNPRARIDELARLVDTDPPIAARFISVANSVVYWRGWATESTSAAIVRMGMANTRDLLFQVVCSTSATGLRRYQKEVEASFERSVTAAIAARIIGPELKMQGEFNYMCGLLHDMGEARVYRILDAMAEPPEGIGFVRELVEKYHCEAGAEVAMAWQLPTDIVDACAAHHDAKAVETPHVRLVMIADAIVEALQPNAAFDADLFEVLGVEAEQAQQLIARVKEEMASAPF